MYILHSESLPDVDFSKASIRTSMSSDQSFIARKKRKGIMQLDSDTDNSIVIEHNRHKKVACLKNTPAKMIGKKFLKTMDMSNDSIQSIESDDDQSVLDDNENKPNNLNGLSTLSIQNIKYSDKSCEHSMVYESDVTLNDNINQNNVNEVDTKVSIRKDSDLGKERRHSNDSDTEEYEIDHGEGIEKSDKHKSEGDKSSDNDDENNEDAIFMSRATRMSIVGFVPKDNESDDSDYIESGNVSLSTFYNYKYQKLDLPFYLNLLKKFQHSYY